MCGIVGYTGAKKAAPILIEGLTGLEYRGYDSSGVAVLENGQIKMVKAKGRLKNLVELTDNGERLPGTVGIGHTRWATHGEPSDVNSHPHISKSGRFAVVHNGIIENYLELRDFLIARGYEFVSQTDTEVIAHLIEYYYNGDPVETLRKVMNKLEGSYALGVLSCYAPDTFYAARKDSPLVVGLGEHENFIASDMPAVLKYTRRFLLIDDGEIVAVSPTAASVFNRNREPVEKQPFTVEWDVSAAEKNGYPHFMLKEIYEQPKAVEATLSPRIKNGDIVLDTIAWTEEQMRTFDKINVVACGSAYHAGMIGKYFIEKLCRIPVEIDVASEFRYRAPIVGNRTLTVVISQSGETADTLAGLREAKKLGSRVLSIVNVVGSSIARESDDVLYTWAGPEIAVATTKGYTSQVAALMLLGLKLARVRGTVTQAQFAELLGELQALPDQIRAVLDRNVEQIQYLSSVYFASNDAFFIGRGMDYALALEGALKLKEISYIHAESYAAGELKHGTISLIEKGSLVIAVAVDKRLHDKMRSNIKEVKTRGATVIALAPVGNNLASEVDHVVTLPDCGEDTYPVVAVTALQLLGYYIASARGCDIDKPRNLAKSVTVE